MSAPESPADLIVVWRDNGEALVTTRKHPDEKRNVGNISWPAGISGYYLGTHVRPATFHPSALALLAAPSLPEGPDPEGKGLDGSLAVADAARQIRENFAAVDFISAPWEDGERVICLCGKAVGQTLTPHDASVILAWLKSAWQEIAESLLKVSPEEKGAKA